VVPQLGAILGPCIGAGAFGPALSDFVCMMKTGAHMYLSGPEVIHAASGVELSPAELGGAAIHSEITGGSHFLCMDEEHCLAQLRELVGFLPLNNLDDPPPVINRDDPHRKTEEIASLIDTPGASGYDIRELIRSVVDNRYWLEVSQSFAGNLVTGLARLDGRSVAIVANQPQEMAGVLDIDAARKGARFVRFCDAFNLPLIVFEDVPGFVPGQQQEHDGIIRAAAQLLFAMAEATVPKLTVIVRRAYGGASCIMNPKSLRADLVVAYPGADIGLINPAGAATILKMEDSSPAQTSARHAATTGYLDAVIDPADTRRFLINALTMASNKRDLNPPRKHGNIPL
jgi:acetyl-CoA carboxylase carboxyltransferase component